MFSLPIHETQEVSTDIRCWRGQRDPRYVRFNYAFAIYWNYFEVPPTATTDIMCHRASSEFIQWMATEYGPHVKKTGTWTTIQKYSCLTVLFTEAKDAMVFKLRWL